MRNKRVSGVDTVVLWTSLGENVAIPLEWTDHADPSPFSPPSILDGECLVALTDLLESLKEETNCDSDTMEPRRALRTDEPQIGLDLA